MAEMKRVHPEFMRDGVLKAAEKGDAGEFLGALISGMDYWTNMITGEIGPLGREEAPLVIAALRDVADAYAKVFPAANETAGVIRKNVWQNMTVITADSRRSG